MSVTLRNHFVPQLYLKHFASDEGMLHRYRLLVSAPSVAPWKRSHIAGVAYQRHLYTRTLNGLETDDTELWLNREFETPAEGPLSRVVSDAVLSKDDYRILSRFVAAQVVRTPAFFVANLPRWLREAQQEMEESPKRIQRLLQQAQDLQMQLLSEPSPAREYFPSRVARVSSSAEGMVSFRTNMVVGRCYWIFAMRHMLSSTLNRLAEHRWTVLCSPEGLPWFTTDDPVLRLNYQSPSKYDFGGGWGSQGTEIMLPISPRHLLYTQIGHKPPQRGTTVDGEFAKIVRKLIAEHAHRVIYNPLPDQSIARLRKRWIDSKAVQHERDQWAKWHEEQSAAEMELHTQSD